LFGFSTKILVNYYLPLDIETSLDILIVYSVDFSTSQIF